MGRTITGNPKKYEIFCSFLESEQDLGTSNNFALFNFLNVVILWFNFFIKKKWTWNGTITKNEAKNRDVFDKKQVPKSCSFLKNEHKIWYDLDFSKLNKSYHFFDSYPM